MATAKPLPESKQMKVRDSRTVKLQTLDILIVHNSPKYVSFIKGVIAVFKMSSDTMPRHKHSWTIVKDKKVEIKKWMGMPLKLFSKSTRRILSLKWPCRRILAHRLPKSICRPNDRMPGIGTRQTSVE